MLGAALLFSLMGAGVKFASATYGPGEIVFFRAAVGLVLMGGVMRLRGVRLATPVPAMHALRSLAGVTSLCLWFYAIGGLPLGTAITLNYMSSVWIALFLLGGAALLGSPQGLSNQHGLDGRLVASVLAGFAGVALVLRPTIDQQQLWHGLCGLLSGLLAAVAYLQVSALGRAGEPEERVVFYFSLGGVVAGLALALAMGGLHSLGGPAAGTAAAAPLAGHSAGASTLPAGGHSAAGLALLLGIGVLATAAQWMLTRAYAIGSALVNSALQYMGIVFSSLLGVWLFDDPVSAQAVAGMVLIVAAGLAATRLRSRVAAARPLPPAEP